MTSDLVTWPRSTPRLTLRLPVEGDIDQLLAHRRLPEATRWLLRNQVDEQTFTAAWIASVDDEFDHAAVVELEGRVIGSIGLEVVDGMGQEPRTASVRSEGRLGYVMDPAWAGHGYATEAAESMLALAFDELGLHRVTAGCFADNTASWRVMEKLGMRREQHGVRDSWHAELGWVDGFTYAILREEWRGRGSMSSRDA